MAIKVVFPTGGETATATGLYQWDYGQTLEIECAEINSEIIEVHFACPNMTEAIPRPCTFINGIGTVPIPDQCLEQENTITAWIYVIDDTQGRTIKTITLPITKRTKPIRTREVPTELVDKYAELLVEVGETIDALKNGNIKVAKATFADTANKANKADTAENAISATSATRAEFADLATVANSVEAKFVTSCYVSGTTEVYATGTSLLRADTAYIAVYRADGSTTSHVVALSPGTSYPHYNIPIPSAYYITLHFCNGVGSDCKVSLSSDSAPAGTLNFYSLGTIDG